MYLNWYSAGLACTKPWFQPSTLHYVQVRPRTPNTSTQTWRQGGSDIQGPSCLYSGLETSLRHKRTSHKQICPWDRAKEHMSHPCAQTLELEIVRPPPKTAIVSLTLLSNPAVPKEQNAKTGNDTCSIHSSQRGKQTEISSTKEWIHKAWHRPRNISL